MKLHRQWVFHASKPCVCVHVLGCSIVIYAYTESQSKLYMRCTACYFTIIGIYQLSANANKSNWSLKRINNSVSQIKKNSSQLEKQMWSNWKILQFVYDTYSPTQIHFIHDESMASDLVESNRKYLIFLVWITKNVPVQSGEQKNLVDVERTYLNAFVVVHDKNAEGGKKERNKPNARV